jgi:hypothetical protein
MPTVMLDNPVSSSPVAGLLFEAIELRPKKIRVSYWTVDPHGKKLEMKSVSARSTPALVAIVESSGKLGAKFAALLVAMGGPSLKGKVIA